MKALDTNVLVRFLIGDDPRQSSKVRNLVERAERDGQPLFISLPVLLETIEVLDSSYGCSRSDVLDAFEGLTLTPVFLFEKPEQVKEWIRRGRSERTGLADLLIGLTARDAGCEATLTFDRRAAQSDLFEWID